MGADSDTAGMGGGNEPESSDSLRTFGAMVQALREHAGLSREELADLIGYSKHMVASVEQGRRMPDMALVEGVDRALGGTGALIAAGQHLGRQPGLAAWFRKWARLEAGAITLYTYECRMIPGLLQTEEYLRAMSADQLPPMDDEQIEQRWAARAKRQGLLRDRANTAFSFILEEHLFLRRTGGAAVTRGLIDHVLQISGLRNVDIQVMPLVQESHSGLHGPIRLCETAESRWFAYNEGQESGQLISDVKVVSALKQRYVRMRSQALSIRDSLSLLQRMRGDL
ncbi:helix-turn-helix domain-containing protein [Streptomyces ipomoeae]|jgi:transcriptional regulator with XRE-family HTH domain|uniref:Toxin-antitoxin system, antitoxin component, Xre family n=2 Tax=Streptomyces ipomoeae TaxID=103232 RepID=L1KSH3_9ACTN|nr:toxin-antitoxin system, antitoxin component, Xre family [Streptomyces ipomoeae 91-03]TQE18570.1 helix-turn-helix domain-containing protein [Streptomyces ipomoeae]